MTAAVITQFDFYGDQLIAINNDGIGMVALRPICDSLGVDFSSQRKKVIARSEYCCGEITTTGYDGRKHEMLCIPISKLSLWLANLNANKVKPEIKEKLLRYKAECADILYMHFGFSYGSKQEVVAMLKELGMKITLLCDKVFLLEERAQSTEAKLEELDNIVRVSMPDSEVEEIRSIIEEIKQATGMDGRAIVGHVRQTLGTSGIYEAPNLRQVKNVLRNMLGKGVLGLVEELA